MVLRLPEGCQSLTKVLLWPLTDLTNRSGDCTPGPFGMLSARIRMVRILKWSLVFVRGSRTISIAACL